MSDGAIAAVAIGVLIFVLVVVALRRSRPGDRDRAYRAEPLVAELREPASTMLSVPDMGTPGTMTERQATRLRHDIGADPPASLSLEQASLLISAVEYAQSVFVSAHPRKDVPRRCIGAAIALIVSDDELRKYIQQWNRRRWRAGSDNISPRRHKHYFRVLDVMNKVL